MHYKHLLDPSVFIGSQDFPEPKTVTISKVIREAMPEREGEEKKSAAMMYFTAKGQELKRKYKVPKSVLYGLSIEFGPDTDNWIGKEITLFAAKCMAFGEVEECVRIKFSPDTVRKIYRWLKKRKAGKNAYIMEEKE